MYSTVGTAPRDGDRNWTKQVSQLTASRCHVGRINAESKPWFARKSISKANDRMESAACVFTKVGPLVKVLASRLSSLVSWEV